MRGSARSTSRPRGRPRRGGRGHRPRAGRMDHADFRLAPPIEGLHPDRHDHPADRQGALPGRSGRLCRGARSLSGRGRRRAGRDRLRGAAPVTGIAAALADGAPLVDETLPSNLVSHQHAVSATRAASSRAPTRSSRRALPRPARPMRRSRRAAAPRCGTRAASISRSISARRCRIRFAPSWPRRLRLKESQVTVISPDVGGGFGQKIALYREELTVAALARQLKRPVRWREDRMENLVASRARARDHGADPRRGQRRGRGAGARGPRSSRISAPTASTRPTTSCAWSR